MTSGGGGGGGTVVLGSASDQLLFNGSVEVLGGAGAGSLAANGALILDSLGVNYGSNASFDRAALLGSVAGFGVVSGISSDQFNLSSGGGGAGAGGDGTLIGDTSSTPEPGSLFLATLGMAAIFVSRIIAWFDRNRQTL